jgi:nitronate monooxygenase
MLISAAGSLPPIIQGGMGVGVSNWRLAQAVSLKGMLGVISGTVIDAVMVRRLQLGDPGGHMRRALAAFPCASTAQKMLDDFFVEGGIPAGKPFHSLSMPSLKMNLDRMRTMVVAAFAETWLAREGHTGPVGINLLEKVQLPNLPTLYGAMLAGAHAVLMGAGVPLAIPGALDGLAAGQEVRLRLDVREAAEGQTTEFVFDPAALGIETGGTHAPPGFPGDHQFPCDRPGDGAQGQRPGGRVRGREPYRRGAQRPAAPERHPPRRGTRVYGAGHTGPGAHRRAGAALLGGRLLRLAAKSWTEARAPGAAGIQIGSAPSPSAASRASHPSSSAAPWTESRAGRLTVLTDFRASPTGYPFKLIPLEGTLLADGENVTRRKRVCDLGFLRSSYDQGGRRAGLSLSRGTRAAFRAARAVARMRPRAGSACATACWPPSAWASDAGRRRGAADHDRWGCRRGGGSASCNPGRTEYTAAQVIDRVHGAEVRAMRAALP